MAEKKKKGLVKQDNTPVKKSDFLAKVRQSKAVSARSADRKTLARALETSGRPRLLFAMDATASREPSWNVAKEITGAMFEAVPGELDVALAYHGGGRLKEVTPFSSDARAFLDKIQQVRCQAGGTALNDVLVATTDMTRLKALIYIGDCFEESADEARTLAGQLKLKGVRSFMFHEEASWRIGYDVTTAQDVFGMIAQITGGALLPFDENAPEKVKELLEAIAIYAVGGIRLLEQKQRLLPAAKHLLEQMRS